MITEPTTVTISTIEAEIRIDASVDAVWDALTTGIGAWWPHRFEDEGSTVRLEPWVGGRFYETYGDGEDGGLYAHVTFLERGRVLRTSGPMGLRGAGIYVKTYRLEADGEGTIVRTHAEMLGRFDDETVAGYQVGNQAVVDALKTFVEPSRTDR